MELRLDSSSKLGNSHPACQFLNQMRLRIIFIFLRERHVYLAIHCNYPSITRF